MNYLTKMGDEIENKIEINVGLLFQAQMGE